MCYDISFTIIEVRELSDYFPELIFDQQMEINFESAVHIAGHAYQNHPIIYLSKEDQRLHCRLMEWGVIRSDVKVEKDFEGQRTSMLNARAERILDDPKSYWYKIRNNRCLIPVSAIYEHRKIALKGWTKKVPYFIKPNDQSVFFLPALYSKVELPDLETGEMVIRHTFVMITTNAESNFVMRNIHNDSFRNKVQEFRMPLFLPLKLSHQWLKKDISEQKYREVLNYKIAGEDLYYHPVYTIRTSLERPDGKPKNKKFEWKGLPPLGEANPVTK